MFNNRKETVSLLALQSCLLLHIIAFVEGDMESQSLYGALAIRMVQLLDLPRKLSSDRVERETQIRSKSRLFHLPNSTKYFFSMVDNLVNG